MQGRHTHTRQAYIDKHMPMRTHMNAYMPYHLPTNNVKQALLYAPEHVPRKTNQRNVAVSGPGDAPSITTKYTNSSCVKMVLTPPSEPNGQILTYQVSSLQLWSQCTETTPLNLRMETLYQFPENRKSDMAKQPIFPSPKYSLFD